MKRALVISLICVLGLGFSGLAATLSGYWDTDVTINPTVVSFADAITLTSELGVDYTVGDWTFGSTTNLDDTGWVGQDFAVAGVLGAFSIGSSLVFDPVTTGFTSWTTSAGVSIAGVSFGMDFTLAGGSVALVLSGAGVAGDVSVAVDVMFGDPGIGCDLDWTGVDVTIGFPFCCAADVTLVVEFDCTGFVSACFSVAGIAVPNMPYLTLDADLCFTMDEKTLTLSPNFDFGVIACFDLYFDATQTGNLAISNISIEGLGLSCDIGAVTFTGLSFWGEGAKPGLLSGTDYWEVYNIATNDDACCGPFTFDLSIYFLDQGNKLFDVALFDANMTLQVAAQFSFNMGLQVDVEAGNFALWTVGFEVTW
jgi:hypothetical protein